MSPRPHEKDSGRYDCIENCAWRCDYSDWSELPRIRGFIQSSYRLEHGIGDRDADTKRAVYRSLNLFVAAGVIDYELIVSDRNPNFHPYRDVRDHVIVEKILGGPAALRQFPEFLSGESFSVYQDF